MRPGRADSSGQVYVPADVGQLPDHLLHFRGHHGLRPVGAKITSYSSPILQKCASPYNNQDGAVACITDCASDGALILSAEAEKTGSTDRKPFQS